MDYLIWLKGGGCLEGTVDNETAERIMKHRGKVLRFYDTDGLIKIRTKAIDAIAVNNQGSDTQVKGFR